MSITTDLSEHIMIDPYPKYIQWYFIQLQKKHYYYLCAYIGDDLSFFFKL